MGESSFRILTVNVSLLRFFLIFFTKNALFFSPWPLKISFSGYYSLPRFHGYHLRTNRSLPPAENSFLKRRKNGGVPRCPFIVRAPPDAIFILVSLTGDEKGKKRVPDSCRMSMKARRARNCTKSTRF